MFRKANITNAPSTGHPFTFFFSFVAAQYPLVEKLGGGRGAWVRI